MITKRISGQQKQPGSFILQAVPLSRSYHVAESICRIYNIMVHPNGQIFKVATTEGKVGGCFCQLPALYENTEIVF